MLFLVLFLTGLFQGSEVKASTQAHIRDIVVANSQRHLLLYLQVDKAFSHDMEKGVLNGIPALFTFFVSIREIEDGRPGRRLTEMEFDHALSYDPLKEVFKLSFSEDNAVTAVEEFERAKTLMTKVNGVRVVDLARLEKGKAYFLSVKVRLERRNLPLFLQYLIPFWQLRDEETDWQYVEFRY